MKSDPSSKPKTKERLDVVLVERGLADSRTKAQAIILAGNVFVNGAAVMKVGTPVGSDASITVSSGPKYVSRGGDKLEGALSDFSLVPYDMVCLDVGASTGGFSDCLLKNGARKVYAVDVGHGQLDVSLRKNPNVINLEKTHINELTREPLKETIQFVVIDVSFISLRNVLPAVSQLIEKNVPVLALVKPQFEVGPKFLKKGVVRSVEVQQKAVDDIIAFAIQLGFKVEGRSPSKLKGPKGNQEYFLYLK